MILIENLFATSLLIFIFMMMLVCTVKEFNLWAHRRYDKAIVSVLILSEFGTVYTAAAWIWRAWS